MPFRIVARTILHLGAELISSDSIAFYEIIKNAIDAGSKRVEIHIIKHISHEDYKKLSDALLAKKKELGDGSKKIDIRDFQNQIISKIDISTPKSKELRRQVVDSKTLDDLSNVLEEANCITFEDTGEGMSLEDLSEIFLTIGTRSRLKQKENQRKQLKTENKENEQDFQPILGEKGVGRLAVMRLGNKLKVTTSKQGEIRWNILEIDWTLFSHNSDVLLDQIKISPYEDTKREKEDRNFSGTTIRISGLSSDWTEEKLVEIARNEFSRLIDPFGSRSRYPILLRFNGKSVSIPIMNKLLFQYAHASVKAKFTVNEHEKPQLSGKIDYLMRKREKTFQIQGTHLISLSGIETNSDEILRTLGPFKMELYWYNRRLLKSTDVIGDSQQVKILQKQWAGGLMVYRDGFRVNPYGSPNDDWLDIDRIALASQAYKVNRRQIIGKVDLSSISNFCLVDQTNREGLRDCPEKQALMKILVHIIIVEFKKFMDTVDEEIGANDPIDFEEIEEQVEVQKKQLQENLDLLIKKHPEVKQSNQIITKIRETSKQSEIIAVEAKKFTSSFQKKEAQMFHLAALGLMVEILAHELNRATSYTLRTLSNIDTNRLPLEVQKLFITLEAQLSTLQKRIRILDPLSTSGRQKQESFDLIEWVQEIFKYHEGQFQRDKIHYELSIKPQNFISNFRIKAVKGMIVQVLENLISNSVYWLKLEQKLNPSFVPEIKVAINVEKKELYGSLIIGVKATISSKKKQRNHNQANLKKYAERDEIN